MPLAPVFADLAAERAAVRAESLAGRGGVPLARRLTDAWDRALRACFDAALAAHPVAGAALLAVGGYGRGTLAPGSDLDLVVLVPDPDAPAVAAFTEALLHPLWDAKVAVGHAVRSPEDFASLARTDVKTTTAVLDARLVAGDEPAARAALADTLRAALDGGVDRFLAMLVEEMSARHARFGGTVYLLEPDVKHSRGALRDLDIARWALRARHGSRGFDEALRDGALSPAEHESLTAAESFTWRLRMALHARTGRRNDRLSFDEQEEAAPRVVDASAHDDPVDAVGDAVERMMSAWYRHARAVSSVVEHVLARSRATRQPPPHRDAITDEVVDENGALTFARADALRRDPALALRVVELAVARELPLAASARSRVAAAARDPAWCEALRADAHAAGAFLRLLTNAAPARLRDDDATPVSETETNAGSVLAELHDLGLVLAMIPEFAAVTGRVQHDIYHVYTVDVHSVAAVDRLHAIARGELGGDFALPTVLMADTDRVRDAVPRDAPARHRQEPRGRRTRGWAPTWPLPSPRASASGPTTPPSSRGSCSSTSRSTTPRPAATSATRRPSAPSSTSSATRGASVRSTSSPSPTSPPPRPPR
jgi:[protein-PII] uridylyltransferase